MSDPVEEMAAVLYQAAGGWRLWENFQARGKIDCRADDFRAMARNARAHFAAQQAGLVEALGWFIADPRFQVGVGGNPIAVEKMIADAKERYELAKVMP